MSYDLAMECSLPLKCPSVKGIVPRVVLLRVVRAIGKKLGHWDPSLFPHAFSCFLGRRGSVLCHHIFLS